MRKAQKLVVIVVGLIVLTGFGFLYLEMVKDPRIAFLPKDNAAQWIRYPLPLQTMGRVGVYVDLDTLFKRTFHVDAVPSRVMLHVKAFKRFRLWINGIEAGRTSDAANWKKRVCLDVTGFVRRGENIIRVEVSNRLGPPALWLHTDGLRNEFHSDTTWSVSLLGSRSVPAVIASDIVPHPISQEGTPPLSSLISTWPWLTVAFAFSILI